MLEKLKVSGLRCHSCKALVEEDVRAVEGVRQVEADYRTGIVTVEYDGREKTLEKVKQVLVKLGYKIGDINAF